MLLFVGPQHLPSAMSHLALRGHIGQEHKAASLLHLTSDDLAPFVQRHLQPIPPGFDRARLVGTGPSRAIRGAFLDHDLYCVIAALQRPHLLSSRLGIRATEVVLLRRLTHGGCQSRPRRGYLTGEALLTALILAAGVDHHRPIMVAVEGDGPLRHFV